MHQSHETTQEDYKSFGKVWNEKKLYGHPRTGLFIKYGKYLAKNEENPSLITHFCVTTAHFRKNRFVLDEKFQ